MKAIIIDDEAKAIDSLRKDLAKHCPQLNIVATADNPKEGLLAIKKHNPDLVFLDVAMPWMNGFEMLELLPQIDFALIFTTAHDEFAARAFRASAIDYLLKPIAVDELKQAVAKAEAKRGTNVDEERIVNLLHNYHKPEQQKVAIPVRDGYEFLETENMVCLLADGAYTNISLNDGRKLLVSKSIGELNDMLPEEMFIRIHHSSVVNQRFITHFIRSDGGYVQLANGIRLMVSKSKKDNLMNKLGLK